MTKIFKSRTFVVSENIPLVFSTDFLQKKVIVRGNKYHLKRQNDAIRVRQLVNSPIQLFLCAAIRIVEARVTLADSSDAPSIHITTELRDIHQLAFGISFILLSLTGITVLFKELEAGIILLIITSLIALTFYFLFNFSIKRFSKALRDDIPYFS